VAVNLSFHSVLPELKKIRSSSNNHNH